MSSSESLSNIQENIIKDIKSISNTQEYDFNDSLLSKYKRKSKEILERQRTFPIADQQLEQEALQQYRELNQTLYRYTIDNPVGPPKSQNLNFFDVEQNTNLGKFYEYRVQPSDDGSEGIREYPVNKNTPSSFQDQNTKKVVIAPPKLGLPKPLPLDRVNSPTKNLNARTTTTIEKPPGYYNGRRAC